MLCFVFLVFECILVFVDWMMNWVLYNDKFLVLLIKCRLVYCIFMSNKCIMVMYLLVFIVIFVKGEWKMDGFNFDL